MQTEREILEITMLGSMHILWRGEEIRISGNRAPRFLQLLQLVWLRGGQGVTRQDILRDLYEGKNLSNLSNCINNLVLQARRHLQDAGLPRADYIVLKEGKFVPEGQIEMNCDAEQFHRLIAAAREAGESGREEEQEMLCREAFAAYSGALLPEQAGLPWVEREARRFAGEYREAADVLVRRARQRGEETLADEVRDEADRRDPAGAQAAMAAAEREGLPQDIVSRFVRTQAPCTAELPGSGQPAGNAIPPQEVSPPPQPRRPGGYWCSSPEGLLDVVRVLQRNLGRAGFSASLVRLRLVDYKGDPIQKPGRREARMLSLGRCIAQSLGRGDAAVRSGDSEYLLLLIGYTGKGRERVLRRIRTSLRNLEGSKAKICSDAIPLSEER